MAKLILNFRDRVIQELPLGTEAVTIGRPQDNDPHARVAQVDDTYVLEDLESTNGTFIDGQRIGHHRLRDGDEVVIGKHMLAFVDTTVKQPTAPLPVLDGTVFLDTEAHRKMLADLPPGSAGAPAPVAEQVLPPIPIPASLTIVAGAPRDWYPLTEPSAIIGATADATVRLRGWFKPRVAVVVSRAGDDYLATPVAGRPRLNGQRLRVPRLLRHDDLLKVSGVTVKFAAGSPD